MKFKIVLFFLLSSGLASAQQDTLNADNLEHVRSIIAFFAQRNVDSIGKMVRFPLFRDYPVPAIRNEAQFKSRFKEVFDDKIIASIAHSCNFQMV